MDATRTLSIITLTALISAVTTYHFSRPKEAFVDSSVQFCKENNHPEHRNLAPPPPNTPINKEPTKKSTTIALKEQAPPHQQQKTTPSEAINIRQRIERETRNINFFRQFLKNKSPSEVIISLEEKYTQEDVDYEWSSSKEQSLLSLFNTDKNLSTYSPLNLSCKSSSCKVTMAAQDNTQAKIISQHFLNAVLSTNQENPEQTVSSFSDPETGELIMYVSQNGNRNLFDKNSKD